MPTHLRWELAPVPKERDRGRYGGSYLEEFEWWTKPRDESLARELAFVLREVLLLEALHEHNRRLWWFSYPFHLGLYLLFASVACGVIAAAVVGPESAAALHSAIDVTSGAAFAMGAVGGLGLVASRMFDGTLRRITTLPTYVNLLAVIGVFATGAVAVGSVPGFAGGASSFAWGLFTASAPEAVAPALAAHVLAMLVFLAYLPFTRMMHFVAKFFTYHRVRWDDRSLERGTAMEAEMTALLGQRPTWAAEHVGADGKKTWVDIATEEKK
jgi:nitrate reductase gamma subunit